MSIINKLSRSQFLLAISFAAACALSACGKTDEAAPPAVSVASVELGSAIDEGDLHIVTPTTTFAPHDRVYASVTTRGPGLDGDSVKMDANWIDQNGQVVFHSSHVGIAGGSRPDLLSAAKPEGFAPGNYKLEILLDGAPAASTAFSVK